MKNLIQLIVEWAKVAYNWITNFLKIVWGFIQSYWPKLKELLQEWLREYTEVIILDGREKGGREILNILKQARPSEIKIDDICDIVTLGLKNNKLIAKVGNLEAKTQQEDQYDTIAHQNNGILRING